MDAEQSPRRLLIGMTKKREMEKYNSRHSPLLQIDNSSRTVVFPTPADIIFLKEISRREGRETIIALLLSHT